MALQHLLSSKRHLCDTHDYSAYSLAISPSSTMISTVLALYFACSALAAPLPCYDCHMLRPGVLPLQRRGTCKLLSPMLFGHNLTRLQLTSMKSTQVFLTAMSTHSTHHYPLRASHSRRRPTGLSPPLSTRLTLPCRLPHSHLSSILLLCLLLLPLIPLVSFVLIMCRNDV
jgi:hypothetical protein